MEAPLPNPESATPRPWLVWILGIITAEAVIALLFTISYVVSQTIFPASRAYLPNLLLMPAVGGFAASYVWRKLRPTVTNVILASLVITLAGLGIGSIFAGEGFICLLIVSPLFLISILTGALLGRVLFKIDRSRLRLGFIPLFAIVALVEPSARTEKISVVTDTILIHAPPSRVWPETISFKDIPVPSTFWLFRLGLPSPMATTSEGSFVKASRECIFSHNAVFKETVVQFIPNQNLTFDITDIPPDPELVGHLTPHRGQFLLRDNGDGTTTLSGSTWYTLHVRPNWYFELWTKQIFRAVHLRVMEDIRRRAESAH